MSVASLADAEQVRSVSTGTLTRNKAEPGRKVTAVSKVFGIGHGGNDGCRCLWADSFDLRKALASLTCFEHRIDTPVEPGDAFVELAQLIHQIGEHLTRERRQSVRRVGEDRGNLPTRTRNRLREYDAPFGENAAHLTHKASSIANEAATSTVKALHILLFDGLDRHEAHRRSLQGLANGFGVIAVGLVALHEGLHELRADEFYRVALLLKLQSPMMGA